MHLSFVSWRRWLATLALMTVCGLAPASTASAQAKESHGFIPGGAFGFLELRVADFGKSDFFLLLPESTRRHMSRSEFGNPLERHSLKSLTILFLEPRDLSDRKERHYFDDKIKDPDVKDPDFKDKEPIKPKVLTLDDVDAKTHGGPLYIYTYEEPIDVTGPDDEKTTYKGKEIHRRFGGWAIKIDDRRLLLSHNRSALKRYIDGSTPAKGGLSTALSRAAKDDAHLILAFDVTGPAAAEYRKNFTERLDDEFGFMVFGSLIEPLVQADSIYARLRLHNRPTLEGAAIFKNKEAADRAADAIRDALVIFRVVGSGSIRQSARFMEKYDAGRHDQEVLLLRVFADELEATLRDAKVEVDRDSVKLTILAKKDVAGMKDAVEKAAKALESDPAKKDARLRKQSENNLRQIGIAMHSFHDVTKRLPPQAICDKAGKPLLSWRVAILPYIEEEPLYKQFRLDEPWNSEHNIELLGKMPPLYEPVGLKTTEKNVTFYQVITGPGTMFETVKAPEARFGATGQRLTGIRDGTSNTYMVVEAAKPVPWTKPDDLVYDPKGPVPKVGGLFKDGFHVCYGDALVLFVRMPFREEQLRAGMDGRDDRSCPFRGEK